MANQGHRWLGPAAGLILVTAFSGIAGAQAGNAPCAPWPGEPDPLPTVDTADGFEVTWTAQRFSELVNEALRAEDATARSDARRLWSHALCLNPNSRLAWEGVVRTRPVRTHQPSVRSTRERPPLAERRPLVAALENLGQDVTVWIPPPIERPATILAEELEPATILAVAETAAAEPGGDAQQPPPEPSPSAPAGETPPEARTRPALPAKPGPAPVASPVVAPQLAQDSPPEPAQEVRVAALPRPTPPAPVVPEVAALPSEAKLRIDAVERALRSARFERALVAADRARSTLAALPDGDTVRDARAQVEVMTATAELALGREAEAQASFGRALALDPRLTLDTGTHSPKVLRALDSARAAQARP